MKTHKLSCILQKTRCPASSDRASSFSFCNGFRDNLIICEKRVEDGKSAPAQEWPGVELGYLSLDWCDTHMLDRLDVLLECLHRKLRRYQLEICTVASCIPLNYILSQVGTHYGSNISPSGRDVQLK